MRLTGSARRQRRASTATVGTRLSVRIDPGDPRRVAIDTSRLP